VSFPTHFSGNPLDRADQLRADSEWINAQLTSTSSRFLLFTPDLKALMNVSDGVKPHYLDSAAVATMIAQGRAYVFLGLDEGCAHFALHGEEADISQFLGDEVKTIDARSIAYQGDGPHLGIVAQGRSLLAWHDRRTFCSNCGAKNRAIRGGHARVCTDKSCATEHFPRTDPVVIMLVIDGDDCLLGRGAHFPTRMFSALAGFVEPGENIEEAVRREVFEETGVHVGEVHYTASQPWPFPSSLMIGCIAEATSREIIIDETELADARWFKRAELEAAMNGDDSLLMLPPPLAIAHGLLQHWLSQ
jgi:NAD+ diphosphatase